MSDKPTICPKCGAHQEPVTINDEQWIVEEGTYYWGEPMDGIGMDEDGQGRWDVRIVRPWADARLGPYSTKELAAQQARKLFDELASYNEEE